MNRANELVVAQGSRMHDSLAAGRKLRDQKLSSAFPLLLGGRSRYTAGRGLRHLGI
jgi:hypothetical protein